MYKLDLINAVLALLMSSVHARTLAKAVTAPGYIKYSTVKGYFLQDDPSTNATIFDYVHNPQSCETTSMVANGI